MTDKERIKEWVENSLSDVESKINGMFGFSEGLYPELIAKRVVLKDLLSLINTPEVKDLQEEPVSENLEKAAKDYSNNLDNIYGSIGKQTRNAFKAGAEWQKKHENPASEDFEEALAKEWQGYVDRGAATVDALEDNTQELAFAKGFYRGSKWQKAKMMANATEAVVAIDSGGYPYIDKTIELYDYDKDVPLAKEGDKYKVVLIKED